MIELEGAENQIAMLLQLPDNGLALLDDTLTHWHTNARLLQQMMSWWLNTPPQNNEITLPNTFSQSLYDVLMHQRNLAWRINYAPCRRADMWSRSVHYTCMEKGICRRCCDKKNGQYRYWPVKEEFHFFIIMPSL